MSSGALAKEHLKINNVVIGGKKSDRNNSY